MSRQTSTTLNYKPNQMKIYWCFLTKLCLFELRIFEQITPNYCFLNSSNIFQPTVSEFGLWFLFMSYRCAPDVRINAFLNIEKIFLSLVARLKFISMTVMYLINHIGIYDLSKDSNCQAYFWWILWPIFNTWTSWLWNTDKSIQAYWYFPHQL